LQVRPGGVDGIEHPLFRDEAVFLQINNDLTTIKLPTLRSPREGAGTANESHEPVAYFGIRAVVAGRQPEQGLNLVESLALTDLVVGSLRIDPGGRRTARGEDQEQPDRQRGGYGEETQFVATTSLHIRYSAPSA
jgi:hypothetical protein